MFDFYDWTDVVKFILVCLLVVGIIALCVVAVVKAEESKVEVVVVSCEEGRNVPNAGMQAMSVQKFVQGDTLGAISYNNLSRVGAQKYIVTVEYEGVQYELEMSHKYEVGDVIRVTLPTD